jgi:4-hydroxybenzoate polyprenyltransferase
MPQLTSLRLRDYWKMGRGVTPWFVPRAGYAPSADRPALARPAAGAVRIPGLPSARRTSGPTALARLRLAVRWEEWYASKLPFAWTACAAAAASSTLGDAAVLRRTAAVIVFTCLCAAFGHVANDHADRACDRLAGRRTPVSGLTRGAAHLLLAALALAALAALALAGSSTAADAAGMAALALSAAYSLPPLRLKKHGALGVWAAAAAQRPLPILLAFAALGHVGAEAWAFAAVAQLVGIRWMLVHQVADAANDRRAGVATYVAAAGECRARRLLARVLVPLEVVAIAFALWAASESVPRIWAVAVAAAVVSAGWVALSGRSRAPYSLDGYDRQPLAGFYHGVWPVGAGLLLAAARPALWPIAAAILVWQSRFIAHQVLTAGRLLRQRLAA